MRNLIVFSPTQKQRALLEGKVKESGTEWQITFAPTKADAIAAIKDLARVVHCIIVAEDDAEIGADVELAKLARHEHRQAVIISLAQPNRQAGFTGISNVTFCRTSTLPQILQNKFSPPKKK